MSTVALEGSPIRFVDRVSDLLEIVDYRPILTDAERDELFEHRYEAYLREGAIKPDFTRRMSDRFDDLDNTWNIGIYIDDKIVASMRLNIANSDYPHMPATGVFDDYLAGEIARGQIILDPTRFVVNQDVARHYPELVYATTRIGWMAGEYFGVDQILATARAEHQAFYKRIFGHEVVCDVRQYYQLTKPLSLMVLKYQEVKQRVHRRYPFFRSTFFERRSLFEAPGLPVGWSEAQRRNQSEAADMPAALASA
jgi:N-acyl-L-homoserine lactone synthetase